MVCSFTGWISISATTFLNHVVHVIFSSADKQMVRTPTSAVITLVKDIKPIRNFINKQHICKSVDGIHIAHETNITVPTTRCTLPQPARVSYDRLVTKFLFQFFWFSGG